MDLVCCYVIMLLLILVVVNHLQIFYFHSLVFDPPIVDTVIMHVESWDRKAIIKCLTRLKSLDDG